MRESEIRDYLRETERRAFQVENRLDELHELQLQTLIRRRSHNSGVAWHTSTTAAGVLLIRREIKRQRAQLSELRAEAQAAREWLEELEQRRAQETAEKERQREEQRREEARRREEMEAELEQAHERAEEERQRAQEAQQRAVEIAHTLELERARVVELTDDLENQRDELREARERGGDRPGPGGRERGDDDGYDGSAGVRVDRPRGPGPQGGGGAATPPVQEHDEEERRRDDHRQEHAQERGR